jgi:hypothetical protein
MGGGNKGAYPLAFSVLQYIADYAVGRTISITPVARGRAHASYINSVAS